MRERVPQDVLTRPSCSLATREDARDAMQNAPYLVLPASALLVPGPKLLERSPKLGDLPPRIERVALAPAVHVAKSAQLVVGRAQPAIHRPFERGRHPNGDRHGDGHERHGGADEVTHDGQATGGV